MQQVILNGRKHFRDKDDIIITTYDDSRNQLENICHINHSVLQLKASRQSPVNAIVLNKITPSY